MTDIPTTSGLDRWRSFAESLRAQATAAVIVGDPSHIGLNQAADMLDAELDRLEDRP